MKRRPLRVVILTTWFPSEDQPVQAPFNLKHAQAIAQNHEVRIVHVRLGSIQPTQVEKYAGFRVLRLAFSPRRPWRGFRLVGELRRAISGADLLHTMAFSSALVARIPMTFQAKPWVHTEHWNGVLNPASVSTLWKRMAWLRCVLAKPDRLTGVSTELARVLGRFGRPGATSVVPNVIENPLPLVDRPAGTRLQLVAIGGLVERKNPILAAQTLQWLVAAGHDVAMTWVGDGGQRRLVEQECARLGIAERFTITGFISPEAVFDYLQVADLFFLPSSDETFFASAAEALSAGRPVVVKRMDAYGDFLDDQNGVLVDDLSPRGYGEAILQAVEKFAATPACQIAEPIRARFSLEKVSMQFEEVYEGLLAEDSGK